MKRKHTYIGLTQKLLVYSLLVFSYGYIVVSFGLKPELITKKLKPLTKNYKLRKSYEPIPFSLPEGQPMLAAGWIMFNV